MPGVEEVPPLKDAGVEVGLGMMSIMTNALILILILSDIVIAMRDRKRLATCRYGPMFIALSGLGGSPTGSRLAG